MAEIWQRESGQMPILAPSRFGLTNQPAAEAGGSTSQRPSRARPACGTGRPSAASTAPERNLSWQSANSESSAPMVFSPFSRASAGAAPPRK